MLLGRHDGIVSEKRQVAFPKRFREELGEKILLTKGLDRNLLIVSQQQWKTLLEGTEDKPFTDIHTRQIQRFLFGNATEVELDMKGRFILPEYLKEFAQIKEELVFIGVSRYVEVWAKQEWEKHEKGLSEVILSVAEKITERVSHE